VQDLSWDLMERIFALNTFSTMLMTRLCAPLLERGTDPCIINMTSIAQRSGAPTATIYGASKGAIDAFTRGAARELAPRIRVNAIAPGVILTPFHDRYTRADRLDAMKANTPLESHGSAEHIALAVRFLIENTFITGETIDINGGMFMR
jgi:3-oxoacyl-[acyl-carrier protein] reductase